MVAPTADMPGLTALTRFARQAAGADFALAFQAGADGLALPLAADPGPLPRAFALGRTRFEGADWSDGPQDAGPLALPSAVLLAADRPVQQALFMPTPFPGAPRSGVLLLWVANGAWQCECPFRRDMEGSVMLLRSAFGQMLADHHEGQLRRLAADRFHDLFETVPTGIVVLDGDAATALVNQRAAALLGVPAGEIAASQVASRMRALRAGCRNRAALEAIYADLQTDLDYSSAVIWISEDQHIEVDTHPVLGHGRNGRIWLFHDVTARERLDEELRHQAETDALTGIPNRRRFFDLGAAAVQRALRAGDSDARFSVLLLDIDHFKSVNDLFGHPAGDEVLRELSRRCSALLRAGDVMARIGGEEFAVLLPATGAEEAATIAERLRFCIAASPILAQGSAVPVTISVGGTSFAGGDTNLDALLKRADITLYDAKRGGRNRVAFDASLQPQSML